ncbi:MAG: RcnB family protein [Paracoccus sp. (in: a-proteobacteria)]|uniref:RcnB family protein n=1 Tax=Paracoccus sp. TaxID=267 RepID=UPI0039E4D8F3
MKAIPAIVPASAVLLVLAACGGPDEPTGRIYRYPEGTAPATAPVPATVPSGLSGGGRGVIVDYHNHALPEPEDGQHWELRPGAFLLVDAAGRVLSSVPALYTGR